MIGPYGTTDDPEDVPSSWGKWLHASSWGWWCHLTFRLPPSREKAEKLFTAWVHWISQKLYGRSFYRFHDGVRWARGIEWQKRGAIHFHVLVAETEKLDMAEAARKWRKFSGETPKISLYAPKKGATFYLAKVYSGLQTGEIHIGGRWTGRAAGLVGRVA